MRRLVVKIRDVLDNYCCFGTLLWRPRRPCNPFRFPELIGANVTPRYNSKYSKRWCTDFHSRFKKFLNEFHSLRWKAYSVKRCDQQLGRGSRAVSFSASTRRCQTQILISCLQIFVEGRTQCSVDSWIWLCLGCDSLLKIESILWVSSYTLSTLKRDVCWPPSFISLCIEYYWQPCIPSSMLAIQSCQMLPLTF
jgi:hypothetical protein